MVVAGAPPGEMSEHVLAAQEPPRPSLSCTSWPPEVFQSLQNTTRPWYSPEAQGRLRLLWPDSFCLRVDLTATVQHWAGPTRQVLLWIGPSQDASGQAISMTTRRLKGKRGDFMLALSLEPQATPTAGRSHQTALTPGGRLQGSGHVPGPTVPAAWGHDAAPRCWSRETPVPRGHRAALISLHLDR